MMSISYVQFYYMSHLTKTHWSFWLRLSNLTRCIGQISHFSQVDWSKHTCLRFLVKMDMTINEKGPVNQFGPFEKNTSFPKTKAIFSY